MDRPGQRVVNSKLSSDEKPDDERPNGLYVKMYRRSRAASGQKETYFAAATFITDFANLDSFWSVSLSSSSVV